MEQEIQLQYDLHLPPAQILKAGTLSCMYEAGTLRYISKEKTELVRKVYGAVRNENWTTIPYEIQDENIISNENSFTITYTALYNNDINLYKADFMIEGKADSSISFFMKGTALADFKKNRIGLCLLHPLKECKGRNVIVTRPDGTTYQSAYPLLVSPALPFTEMSQLQWITEDRLTVQLTFTGDIFETEDQRNWSDASYKTYSTRSDIPIPIPVIQGDTMEQTITIKISGVAENNGAELHNISERKVPFPQIGYSRSVKSPLINPDVISWLNKIPFDHYRVSVVLGESGWTGALQDALTEAMKINTRLELAVFFSDDFTNEALELIQELAEKQLLVRSVLVLQQQHNVSSSTLVEYVYPVLKAALPAVMIGYGTDVMFVDVNQHRPDQTPFDFISFGIHPQAHAFDNRSLLENLQSHSDIMKTATQISAGHPVCISPITLNDRQSGADERQHASLVACWTLLALQNFSEAYSITFFELFGAAGILVPEQKNTGDAVTVTSSPVYEALVKIYSFQPVWVIRRYINDELLMDGLLLENEKGHRLFFKVPEEYLVACQV